MSAEAKAESAVVLTATVRDWALRRGFGEVARDALSAELLASWEFQERQCDGASCLALEL